MLIDNFDDNKSGASRFTQTENVIYAIWSEVLQIDEINPDDNFFELGGDSLMAMIVLFRVHDELGVELQPNEIYKFPTLRNFSQLIDSNRDALETEVSHNEFPIDTLEEDTGII